MPTAASQASSAAKISPIETSFLPTGVLGVGTNKGAVALALSLREARLCVVNCHLAAHHEKLLQRNTDVQQICKHLRLGAPQVEIPLQFHTDRLPRAATPRRPARDALLGMVDHQRSLGGAVGARPAQPCARDGRGPGEAVLYELLKRGAAALRADVQARAPGGARRGGSRWHTEGAPLHDGRPSPSPLKDLFTAQEGVWTPRRPARRRRRRRRSKLPASPPAAVATPAAATSALSIATPAAGCRCGRRRRARRAAAATTTRKTACRRGATACSGARCRRRGRRAPRSSAARPAPSTTRRRRSRRPTTRRCTRSSSSSVHCCRRRSSTIARCTSRSCSSTASARRRRARGGATPRSSRRRI